MKKIPADKKFLQNIQVIDIAEEGKGVGKSDDLVIFIDKAVPGDIVDVELLRRKKKLLRGKDSKLLSSLLNIAPSLFSEHFGVCGGCKWQHLTYDAQLQFKQNECERCIANGWAK